MQIFLDQVAERVTALIAKLIANHIEIRCAEHQAEIQCRIDEIAARYDDSGQSEVAAQLRSLRQRLATDAIVPSGEALLSQVQSQVADSNFAADPRPESPGTASRPRRTTRRVLSLTGVAESSADTTDGTPVQE
jgi:hypothetical protein